MLTFYQSTVFDQNSIGLIVYYVRLLNYSPKKTNGKQPIKKSYERRKK